jgi:hypothetical protein
MDRSTRRAALGVAAKVALTMSSVSLLECASSVAVEESTATTGATSSASGGGHGGAGGVVSASASVTGTGGVVSSSGAGGASNCGIVEGPDGGLIDPVMFACCIPFLAQYAPDGGGPFSASAAADLYVENCCLAIIGDVDHNYQDNAKVPFQEMNACCTLLSYPVGLACTPWGPPVPPAMPSAWIEEIA